MTFSKFSGLRPIMGDMTQIAAVLIVCGAAAFFAMMAWAGQHHS
ncbi:hypothetical protein [Solirubrobacter deserti]|uniref:Uncharacterized protein n=1 Tax=Solirubrobacter deserti TaxID=2282478 RepID=A0ABT4RIJ4_9ACTN|nr:hypothetical protein [Solirubrobacter deserti]MDA0138332.1 hypothetical protein [Solirubrobacter deserti]